MAKGPHRVHDSSPNTIVLKTGAPPENNGMGGIKDSKEGDEPKEHDRCIESPDRPSSVAFAENEAPTEPVTPTKHDRRMKTLFGQHLQRGRTQLASISPRKKTILLTQSLFILILLVIVIVLAVYLAKANSRPDPPALCTDTSCLMASAAIIASINRTADPCTDFYSYACSGWESKNPVPHSTLRTYSVLDELERRITVDLRHYFDLIPLKYDGSNSFEWKAKKFYKVCQDQEEYELEADQAFKYIVTEVGGWKVLQSWTLNSYSRDNALEKLHAKYGIDVLFKVRVVPDDFTPNQFIIKLSPSGLLLGDRSFYIDPAYEKLAAIYRQFMTDVAKQFGATSYEAETFAKNTFHYEKRIAEIFPDYGQENDLSFSGSSLVKLRIRDLKLRSVSIRWLDFLQSLFPNSGIKESTSILVEHPEFFSKLSTILSSTDDHALQDFYAWRLIVNYIKYLSRPFRVIEYEFQRSVASVLSATMPLSTSVISPTSSQLYNSQYLATTSVRLDDRKEEERWSFCVKTTNQFLDLAVGSIYASHKFSPSSPDNGINKIRETRIIIDALLKHITDHVEHINWIKDAATRDAVKEKLRAMLPMIGYPELLFNRNKLTKHYEDLLVQGNFLRNIEHAIHFRQRKLGELLTIPVSPDYQFMAAVSAQEARVVYSHVGNVLTVGGGLLQSPIYNPSSIASLYGGYGFLLAEQILRAFDIQGVGYSQYGSLNTPTDWLGSKSNETYVENLECLSDSLEKLLLNHPVHLLASEALPLNITVRQFASDSMVDVGALKYAFNTYRQMAYSKGQLHLPGLSDFGINNNDQLFFVSFGQALCESKRTVSPSVRQMNGRTRLPPSIRILNMFNQVPQFRGAFNCHSSSRPQTCTLW